MNQQPPNTTETPGPLSLDVTDGIATLTMARAKQRNPFTQEFKDQIADLLRF